MPYLNFITDELLEKCVREVISDVNPADITKLHKNVVDPFSAVFDCMIRGISIEEWFIIESSRQYQKTLQNRIGTFHQKILSHCLDHLTPDSVFDLVNHRQKYVAEIKNKFNTLNAEGMVKTYDKLTKVLDKTNTYYGYTAYYVEIIPPRKSKKYDTEFTPPDNHTGNPKPMHPKIRKIDGASFYHLVTGDPNGIEKLYQALPTIIRKVREDLISFPEDETNYSDLFFRAYNL